MSQYYHTPIKLTSSEQKYLEATAACKLNYSYHSIMEDEIWIHPHPLLSESAVRPVKAECFAFAGTKAFFKTEGHVPFDIFAAIFFLLTRYEEYLPHQKDAFGRYAHTNALAYKEQFLHLPVINIWLEAFRLLLQSKEPDWASRGGQFAFVPTYDIDIAWSFKNKGFKRNAGAMLQLLAQGRLSSIIKRIKVLTNKLQDPFDSYAWMDDLHQRYGLHPIYFFLLADRTSKLDKNISIKNPVFQQLVRDVAARYTVGLHPSWQSGDVRFLLKKEKGALEMLINRNVQASRQHYIRFTVPETYRRLIDAGISHDYSMGYGSINGFRASIATPFYWYDLQKEEKTTLLVHPFCFMDANAHYEQKLTPQQAAEELKHYAHVVQSINGTLCTIWHNSFLGTDPEFEGWREVYEQFVASVHT